MYVLMNLRMDASFGQVHGQVSCTSTCTSTSAWLTCYVSFDALQGPRATNTSRYAQPYCTVHYTTNE